MGQIEADERNDFTRPKIEPSGPLTEGLKDRTAEYPLHVHATDLARAAAAGTSSSAMDRATDADRRSRPDGEGLRDGCG